MPSQRKRIGFLPKEDVQIIIDQICTQNKLSQSKVTGILVEEALNNRGVYHSHLIKNSSKIDWYKIKSLLIANVNFNNKDLNEDVNHIFDESYIKNEIQMINDFIEYKYFKKIMIQNNNNIKE